VAAHLEPEILLVDEVLAVGDAAFQKKCLGKMEGVAREGRTVLFVSHNHKAISDLCDRAIRLEDGRLVDEGMSASIVRRYLEEQLGAGGTTAGHISLEALPSKPMRLRSLSIHNEQGKHLCRIEKDKSLQIRVEYDVNRPVSGAHVVCFVRNEEGVNILGTGDADCTPERLGERPVGHYVAHFELPAFLLRQGFYWITVSLSVPHGAVYDRHEDAIGFELVDSGKDSVPTPVERRPSLLGLELPWYYAQVPGTWPPDPD
jgi:lipopolysaccharide transport system ATP-binding protein